jgi:hypothetical protein
MPAVCRGDSVDVDLIHCSVPRRDECSDNVFVNGIGISREVIKIQYTKKHQCLAQITRNLLKLVLLQLLLMIRVVVE